LIHVQFSLQTLPPCHELEFYFFILFYLELIVVHQRTGLPQAVGSLGKSRHQSDIADIQPGFFR
jgi:hypothetical protein